MIKAGFRGWLRHPLKNLSTIAVLTAIFISCSGKVTYDLTDADLVATSGDFRVPADVFRSVFEVMKRARIPEGKEPRAALFKIIADKYLADDYRKQKGGKFDAAIQADIEKTYVETLAFFIRDQNPEKLYQSYIKKLTIPEAALQKSLFDEKAEAAYTNVPLRRAEADKVILAVYGNQGEKKLTYAALFDTLPQSGKLHLFTSPDKRSLDDIAQQFLKREFILDFAAAAPPERKVHYAALRQITENSILSRNLRYEMGMENANPHAENPALRERAKKISASRIEEFYAANKENYKEVQTVDCRHIKLKSYDTAHNLRDQIEAGANMVALVKKHSLADDKNAADPGLISGIKNDPELHKRPRIQTLCMQPKQGQVDVVRDGEFFEVVKSEKRTEGYPPLDNTTHLREDLARDIAVQDLKKEFDARKNGILRKVDIRINKAMLEKVK